MEERLAFYRRTISKWIPDRQASILIVAGGKNDQDVFYELDFKNVVVSNISITDQETPTNSLAPYAWSHQNVEALTYGENTFDYVVVHSGLHHCQSPHRGLLEMYRVAKKAVIAFEPPDNLLIRLMQRIGLALIYETPCCGGQDGGVNNTDIPNYVYRWTEREIEKAISSYAPIASHRFYYAYASGEPSPPLTAGSVIKRVVIRLAKPAYRLWGMCFPRQQNMFAFMVEKPILSRDLHPWLVSDGSKIRFDHKMSGT